MTLSGRSLAALDRVELDGELLEKPKGYAALSAEPIGHERPRVLATRLARVEGKRPPPGPLEPQPLGPPLFVFLPLAVFAAVRAALSIRHGATALSLCAELASALLVGLAFHLRRRLGLRFFSLQRAPPTRSSRGWGEPRWAFLNGTYAPDAQAFYVLAPAVSLGFAMLAEQTGTKDFAAQGPWPVACIFVLLALGSFWSEWGTRRAARILLRAAPIADGSVDGQWGAVTGTIRVQEPRCVLGV